MLMPRLVRIGPPLGGAVIVIICVWKWNIRGKFLYVQTIHILIYMYI